MSLKRHIVQCYLHICPGDSYLLWVFVCNTQANRTIARTWRHAGRRKWTQVRAPFLHVGQNKSRYTSRSADRLFSVIKFAMSLVPAQCSILEVMSRQRRKRTKSENEQIRIRYRKISCARPRAYPGAVQWMWIIGQVIALWYDWSPPLCTKIGVHDVHTYLCTYYRCTTVHFIFYHSAITSCPKSKFYIHNLKFQIV